MYFLSFLDAGNFVSQFSERAVQSQVEHDVRCLPINLASFGCPRSTNALRAAFAKWDYRSAIDINRYLYMAL